MNRPELIHTFSQEKIITNPGYSGPLYIYHNIIPPPILSTALVIPQKKILNFVPIQERVWTRRQYPLNSTPYFISHQRKDIRSEQKTSTIIRSREEQKRREQLQIKNKKIEHENFSLKNQNRILQQKMEQINNLLKISQQKKQKDNLDTKAESILLDERRLKRTKSTKASNLKFDTKQEACYVKCCNRCISKIMDVRQSGFEQMNPSSRNLKNMKQENINEIINKLKKENRQLKYSIIR